MRLATAEVDRYGPLRDCRPGCGDDITIVAGPNESGKTLYLEGLLQLLDPAVTAHMQPGPRVEGTPAGRVVLADGDDRHELGDGAALSDVSRIGATHLHNLFVVRDSDLALPAGAAYYTSLVEHLGDVHTSAIEDVRSELLEEGRLTASRLSLANREFDTKEVVTAAESLAEDVEASLESIDAEGVNDAVRERLRLRRELAAVEAELETQRTAEAVASLADATDRLREYADATETALALSAFDRETLETLRKYEHDLDTERERIEEVDATLDRKRTELARYRDERAEARERHTELREREGDVERAEATLTTYRDSDDGPGRDGDGGESRLALWRTVTTAGLVGGGLAAAAGAVAESVPALLLGVVLAAIAVVAWGSHRRHTTRRAEAGARERELLRAARDAGFEVDGPADVAPALRTYHDELSGLASRLSDLEARVEETARRVEELEDARHDAAAERRRLAEDLSTTLDSAGVESVEDYEAALERRETHRRRRADAEAVLRNELGDPPSDDPEERVEYWESATLELERDVDAPDVTPEQYDQTELARLRDRREELESRLAALEADLADVREEIAAFERRAGDVPAVPFVDMRPSLSARTVEGLRTLADELREFVGEIRRNAEVSRKAIGILDEIRADEEQKVTRLFDPDGPASEAFAHLTDGRYSAVEYDPGDETLQVRAADGQPFSPHELSRGTRDQLYFAARLSLARQLLGGEPGFFLLDDPFLAADRDRLRNGFETLSALADDGWQVVYLTAKPEVHETMAAEFDCPVRDLEPLAY